MDNMMQFVPNAIGKVALDLKESHKNPARELNCNCHQTKSCLSVGKERGLLRDTGVDPIAPEGDKLGTVKPHFESD